MKKKKKRKNNLLVYIFIAVMVWAWAEFINPNITITDYDNNGSYQTNQNENVGTIIRVVDGDTYVLNINGVERKVRLIGVDTPESVAPDTYRKENSEQGKTVSQIVKDKVQKGDVFTIEYDQQQTDRYGRTLAYLYFNDGTMLQDWLLKNGYANVATYKPNVKYKEHFESIAYQAYQNQTGLWNGYFKWGEQ